LRRICRFCEDAKAKKKKKKKKKREDRSGRWTWWWVWLRRVQRATGIGIGIGVAIGIAIAIEVAFGIDSFTPTFRFFDDHAHGSFDSLVRTPVFVKRTRFVRKRVL
jgi:hypothetical protein